MAGWDVEIGKKCEKCVYWLPPMPFEKNLRILFVFFQKQFFGRMKLMKNVFCNCLRCHLWTILEFIAGSKHLNKKVSAMQYFIRNIWSKYKYKYKPLPIQPSKPTFLERKYWRRFLLRCERVPKTMGKVFYQILCQNTKKHRRDDVLIFLFEANRFHCIFNHCI